MAAKYRLCPKCKYRYEKVKKKCPSCGKARPKKRVPKHAITLRDHNYDYYREVSEKLHGVTDESCNVCRKPKPETRRHDRDHDHRSGNPRGLACSKCNMLMKFTELDAHRAQLIADYLKRAEQYPDVFTKPEDKCSPPDEQTAFPKNS